MDEVLRKRSIDGRVAHPVPPAPPPAPGRSSLVPDDVWQSWQRELATQDAEADDAVLEVSELDVVSSSEHPTSTGLQATTPADFEVALFALGQVQLFSKLEREVIETLARSARQGELQGGDYLFKEDQVAHSFFVVLDGAVEILRRSDGREVALRHLDRCEPVGLFGVLSGQRRAACARAIGDAMLLELPANELHAAIAKYPSLHARLRAFYEERLLEGFVGSSRLFADVDSIARARIIGKFIERRLRAGETLVHPGEVSNLLAVLIDGKLQLELKPRPGDVPTRYELFPGEFVAQTAAFSGMPSRMRIFAAKDTTLMMLGHRELADLLRDYPALRALSHRLPALAQALDRDVWCAHCAVPGL